MSNFRQVDRQMGFLLPPSVDEWLPERHLARSVMEVIDGLELAGQLQHLDEKPRDLLEKPPPEGRDRSSRRPSSSGIDIPSGMSALVRCLRLGQQRPHLGLQLRLPALRPGSRSAAHRITRP
jgi:hypothetical protein